MCITEFSHQTTTWTDTALCFTESVWFTIQAEVPARPSVYIWFPFQYHNTNSSRNFNTN